MSAFPEPILVQGAVLGPLVPNLTPTGVGVVAETPGYKLEHLRALAPDGLRDCIEISAPAEAVTESVAGDTLYGGPFINHFGHALAEWMHRLWAWSYFGGYDRVVFQLFPGNPPPVWTADLFRACGVDPAKVRFISEPTRFERLHIARQGRVLGGVTILQDYASLFPLAPVPIDPDAAERIYFSRSRHIHRGSYLGERLLEQVLEGAGFRIIRPETEPLAGVLTALRSARLIVFAEGSAIHNLELIGQTNATVLVIARRHGVKARFGELLRTLAPSHDYFRAIDPLPALSWHDGSLRAGEACSVIPIDRLLGWIGEQTGLPLASPSAAEIDQAIAVDLARYLLDSGTGRSATDEQLGHSLRLMRSAEGVRALLDRLEPGQA